MAIRPITSVTAKPLIGPVPNWNRNAAAISAVACVSRIVIQHALEAVQHGHPHGLAVAQLLADALEHQHVRVDADADREDDAGDPRQCERRVGVGHEAQQDQQVRRERHHRVEPGEPVVDEHEDHDEGHAGAGGHHAVADRVAAERGTDRQLLQVLERRRQGARLQDLRELVGLLRREAAGDAVVGAQLALDHRSGVDGVVEHDRELAADVPLRVAREAVGRGRVQREVDLGPVRLVDADAGALEVAARDQRLLADQVEGRLPRRVARPREQLHVVRQLAADALQQRVLRRGRVLDQLERELRGRLDDALGRLDVGHAGQLDQDLVVAAAGRGDHRLGDTERVDAPLERADRLLHGLLLELPLEGVRHLHRELVLAGILDLPADAEEVTHQVAHVLDARGLDAVDREAGRGRPLHGGDLDALAGGLVARGVDGVVGRRVERVLDDDLQHQVDPAAQVEAEVDLALLLSAVVGRPDRDPAGEQEGPVEDRLPAQLRAHEGEHEAGEGR